LRQICRPRLALSSSRRSPVSRCAWSARKAACCRSTTIQLAVCATQVRGQTSPAIPSCAGAEAQVLRADRARTPARKPAARPEARAVERALLDGVAPRVRGGPATALVRPERVRDRSAKPPSIPGRSNDASPGRRARTAGHAQVPQLSRGRSGRGRETSRWRLWLLELKRLDAGDGIRGWRCFRF
jgi:hypothetical protein